MRTICVVTGTRADYGLLRWVMEGLRRAPDLELRVIATAMHLSPEFGLTYREIERDGFTIDRKIEMLLSADTPAAIATSTGLGLIGFASALAELAPDVMVVLGDRFEVHAAVTAALIARIPVAHLHGGETTEGAFDDAMRHAITKMSHLHFVAADEYRRRVVQMGEDPARVFLVGGLGVDTITRTPLLERAEVERRLGCALGERSLLVTFHPTTLEQGTAARQMGELLAALDPMRDTQLLFTMPNADTEGRELIAMVERFVASHSNARAFTSLGSQLYLSTLRQVDAVVGNSSSGLTEAPSFRKATVNIGDRQRGRLRASSVVDCAPERAAIRAAIERVRSRDFAARLDEVQNPYGSGGASDAIVATLREYPLENIVKKSFHDIA